MPNIQNIYRLYIMKCLNVAVSFHFVAHNFLFLPILDLQFMWIAALENSSLFQSVIW